MSKPDRVQSAIDDALAELAAAEPSPDFLPRLRAHVEHTPRPSLWSRWALPAAAVACVVVAAFIAGYDRGAREVAPLPLAAAVPAPSIAALPVDPHGPVRSAIPARHLPTASRPTRSTASRAAAAPEVLVPASERQAVARLAAALRAGSPDAVSMVGALAAENADAISIAPVSVSQIRIEPVVVPPVTVDPPERR
jgi:hypothetical protein